MQLALSRYFSETTELVSIFWGFTIISTNIIMILFVHLQYMISSYALWRLIIWYKTTKIRLQCVIWIPPGIPLWNVRLDSSVGKTLMCVCVLHVKMAINDKVSYLSILKFDKVFILYHFDYYIYISTYTVHDIFCTHFTIVICKYLSSLGA